MPLTIVAEEAPIPVTGRAAQSAANDPDLVAFYTDTLKPRGVPSTSSVVLRFETKATAEKDLRALRKLAREDTPALTIGSDLKPENADWQDGPHLLSVWVKSLFTPRKDKVKPAETPVDASWETPLPVPDETESAPVGDIFQEPTPVESHDDEGKKGWRRGH